MCSPAVAWLHDSSWLGRERSIQPIRESRDALLRADIGPLRLRYGFGTCSDRPPTARNVRQMANVLLIRSWQGADVNGAVPKDLGCRKVPGLVPAPGQVHGLYRTVFRLWYVAARSYPSYESGPPRARIGSPRTSDSGCGVPVPNVTSYE